MDKEFGSYQENYFSANTNDFESSRLKEFQHRVLELLKKVLMISIVLEKRCRIERKLEYLWNIFTFIKGGMLNIDVTDLKVSMFMNQMLRRMFYKKEETITGNYKWYIKNKHHK